MLSKQLNDATEFSYVTLAVCKNPWEKWSAYKQVNYLFKIWQVDGVKIRTFNPS